MEGLQPGETLIKDTGWSPATWWKSMFRQESDKLTLTNRRLIIDTGKMEALRVRFELSLGDITSVDRGSRSLRTRSIPSRA